MSSDAEIIEAEIAAVVSGFVSGIVDLIRQTALDAARAALSDAAHPPIRSARPIIDLGSVDAHEEEAESAPPPGAVISPVSGQRIIPTSSSPIVPIVHPKTPAPLQLSLPLPTPRRFPPARRRTRNPRPATPSTPPPPPLLETAPAGEEAPARKWVVVRRPARDKSEGAPGGSADHAETGATSATSANGSAMNGTSEPAPPATSGQ